MKNKSTEINISREYPAGNKRKKIQTLSKPVPSCLQSLVRNHSRTAIFILCQIKAAILFIGLLFTEPCKE